MLLLANSPLFLYKFADSASRIVRPTSLNVTNSYVVSQLCCVSLSASFMLLTLPGTHIMRGNSLHILFKRRIAPTLCIHKEWGRVSKERRAGGTRNDPWLCRDELHEGGVYESRGVLDRRSPKMHCLYICFLTCDTELTCLQYLLECTFHCCLCRPSG